MQQFNPDNDVEYMGGKSARQLLEAKSTCPILTGVVNTRWGPVSAGNLIAGIAAGAESQRVTIQELVKDLNPHNNFQNAQTSISSIYPATLSGKGDLCFQLLFYHFILSLINKSIYYIYSQET
jgi:hypothetical protein